MTIKSANRAITAPRGMSGILPDHTPPPRRKSHRRNHRAGLAAARSAEALSDRARGCRRVVGQLEKHSRATPSLFFGPTSPAAATHAFAASSSHLHCALLRMRGLEAKEQFRL